MFSFYFALFVYSYSLVLMGSIMWTVLEGFRQLLFKHLNQMLLEVVKKATKKRENFSLSVTYFQKNYIKALIKVSRCNRFFGSLFLALMLVNFPASLVLLTTLISYTLSGPVWAIVAIIFYYASQTTDLLNSGAISTANDIGVFRIFPHILHRRSVV